MSGDAISQSSHQAAALDQQASRPPRRKKRRWRLLAMLLLLGALIWFLPPIVANSPLLGWAVGKASADMNGSVSLGAVKLGWFSPVRISSLEVKDVEGKTIFFAPTLGSERSLAAMLRDYKNLGRFYVLEPKISLVLRDDGSNVEDLLARYLAPDEEEPDDEEAALDVGFSLRVQNAAINIADVPSGRQWRLEGLALELDASSGASGPIAAQLSAALPDADRPGKLAAEARLDGPAGEAALQVSNLPLALLRPAAARFAPGTSLAGLLSATMQASWGNDDADNKLHADLNLESLLATTPALENDRVALERLHAVGEAVWSAEQVEIAKTSLDCDVGSFLFSGVIPLGAEGIDAATLVRRRQQLDGRLDLARLARLLPGTLRIREGMQIESGQLQITAASLPAERGTVWNGQLRMENLTAQSGGRRIAWQQPVLAILQARDDPAGPVIDSLRCESDFLKLHAAGSVDNLSASLSFSLGRLAEQLGQFVDLAGLQLAGEGVGSLTWTRTPQQTFTAGAELQINNFQLTAAGKPPLREPALTLTMSANGQTDLGVNTRIDAAALALKTASDQIDAILTGAVADLNGGGSWPVRLDMQGQLHNWPARLAPWLPTGDWRLDGGYTLGIDATASTENVELRQLKLKVLPLKIASNTLNADESQLSAILSGSWNGAERRVQIVQGACNCDTVAVNAKNVVVSIPEEGEIELAGSLNYQTFIDRLKHWFDDPAAPPSWRIAGMLRGSAEVRQTAGTISGSTDAEVLDMAVIDASGQRFEEPRVVLAAAGEFDSRSKVLQLNKFEFASSMAAAGAAGRAGPAGEQYEAQIDGNLRYDAERIAGLLRPYLGPGARIAGRGQSPLSFRGPLSLEKGTAAAGIGWDRANLYGFQIGPAQLKAAIADGNLRIDPIDLAVSRGRMRVTPHVRLSPEPIELTLPGGLQLENVQIDPAMCASMLKFVAPVLAGVTSAQGSFSIVMDSCRVPLAEPKKSDLAGRLLIHSVQIGPGPLIRELAVLLGRESPAKLRQESVVAFNMKNGRIAHKNLELIFPDLTIRTEGSVGLDQTLDLVAEMPVPPKWLAGNPVAAQALANQVIRIPLKGTLNAPKLDQREIERLSREFIQKAAGNLLENELNKQLDQLDKLLRPRR